MGIALHSYESATGALPYGAMPYSFHTKLLPYMDQTPLYNAINFNLVPWSGDPAQTTVFGISVGLFLCPSETQNGATFATATSYPGCAGHGSNEYPDFRATGVFRWKFLDNSPNKLSKITDGLSSTAAISEWIIGRETIDRRSSIYHSDEKGRTNPTSLAAFTSRCRAVENMIPEITPVKGNPWMHGGYLASLHNHALSINDPVEAVSAGSQHPGGANVCFTDGHV